MQRRSAAQQARLPAAAARQPPPPAEPGRPARSSRPPAGVPVPPASSATRVTDQGSLSITSPASFECGTADAARSIAAACTPSWRRNQPVLVAALPDLRPHRALHRSVSTHSTTKVSHLMISPETRAQIRRYFYAEHWKIGTIARELGVHPDTVRNAIESERFHSTQAAAAHPSSIPTSSSSARLWTNIPAARHAHLPDDSRSRLQRQRRAVAAHRCPLASADPRSRSCDCKHFPASRRKSTGRTSAT